MKRIILPLLALSISIYGMAQAPAIIPEPLKMETSNGKFELPEQSTISFKGNSPELAAIANQVKQKLEQATGRSVSITPGGEGTILLQLLPKADTTLGKEGYRLSVGDKKITIEANQPAGIFYGVQTLWQLFPAAIESKTPIKDANWTIATTTITDKPRFGWRGLMLDVSRHFFTKQQVKDFIDNMVKYKYNMLHLHLTDDQGWRIEIKSLPRLTEVGAWRAERVGRWGDWSKPSPDEPKSYGGFYTQDDIRELIQYAKDRFVTIMPEIDVPGHSMAIVAAYPELSATPGNYQVNAGERFMIWPGNGHFYGLIDNTLNPASEKTYEYLDKIFTELAQLFPFEYIHMGGDECYKGFWEKSDAVKGLMKKEKLANMDEVQSYFVKRVGKIIASKGKKMMGWDEILEGGIAPGAAVMSWRGEEGGIKAANMKHNVVMSPNQYTYVDLYQGDPIAELPTYGSVRLKKSYEFNPVPKGVDPQYILGGQANLWSERLHTVRHAEYMLWPRAFSIAESVWSLPEKKDWNKFIQKTETHFKRLDAADINYSRSMYDPIFSVKKTSDSTFQIILDKEIEDLDIHYTFYEVFPDSHYPVYKQPLEVPRDAVNLRVITSRNGKIIGKMITMPIEELKKRAKIK
ncbi:family 20 glycosylhydrolase [Flavihumibacter rivuli]|uniref:beta-N-acetylhexosaminidase n=1 Tax=Flavihumibacter rivuli TaxID=2838156 RepID=UPI001BDE95D6|nr:family 20 glycosylhydrolase [Flavihumibacter rivuli]ULQ57380.1 family 20 glycosylhydrolase [Flavihumibacter rivuli]